MIHLIRMVRPKPGWKSVIFILIVFNFTTSVSAGIATSAKYQNETLHGLQNCRSDSITKTLDCSNLNFNVIPKNIPNSILLLNLSYNNIEDIDNDSFDGLKRLTLLDLSFNNIRSIKKAPFQGLKSLKSLYLNSNRIVGLESNAFTSLQNLFDLHLSGNKELELGEPFLVHKSLKELYLDNCNIEDFPEGSFMNLTQLEKLTINGNPLNDEITSSAFAPLQKLIKLRMPMVDDNHIKFICGYLLSIDIIMFDEFNVSCTVLLAENQYSIGDAIIRNDTPEITLIRTVKAPTTSPTTTHATSSTTVKPIAAETNQTLDASTQRVSVTTSDGTSTNETIDTDARVVDIDKETINLILLVILGVTVSGLIIGLICRIDICGIKTKLCRSNKSKTSKTNNRREPADTVSPFEEIPLNVMSKSAEAEGQG